jgi:hypothetical protein
MNEIHIDIDDVLKDFEFSNGYIGTYTNYWGFTKDELKNIYDNVSMDDWFEDKQIVEKKIPEFSFV